jgi:hypothetical protein
MDCKVIRILRSSKSICFLLARAQCSLVSRRARSSWHRECGKGIVSHRAHLLAVRATRDVCRSSDAIAANLIGTAWSMLITLFEHRKRSVSAWRRIRARPERFELPDPTGLNPGAWQSGVRQSQVFGQGCLATTFFATRSALERIHRQ